MKHARHTHETGAINGLLLSTILLGIAVLGLGALSVWAYMNYSDQKNNVDSKIGVAVADAQHKQAADDEAKFLERDKQPLRQFSGPDDYGRLSFNYPKTWSVYVAHDISQGGTYQAYLNPVTVPAVSEKQQFALRVTIEQRDYNQVISSYQDRVKTGKLTSSATSSNGKEGARLDGQFTNDIRGSAVFYKIRDKTVTIRTDADTFKPDFEALIKTINFND